MERELTGYVFCVLGYLIMSMYICPLGLSYLVCGFGRGAYNSRECLFERVCCTDSMSGKIVK